MLALSNNEQWVVQRRAVDRIFLVDTKGTLLYESALPWLVARLPDGRKVDVVGLRSLKRPVPVDALSRVDQFVPMRPILVRGPVQDVEDDRTGMWCTTLLYLPLIRDQLSYSGSRHEGTNRFDDFLVTIPAVAELARSVDPARFNVERFTISRWVRP